MIKRIAIFFALATAGFAIGCVAPEQDFEDTETEQSVAEQGLSLALRPAEPQTVCPRNYCALNEDGRAYCATLCGARGYCAERTNCQSADDPACITWGQCSIMSGPL